MDGQKGLYSKQDYYIHLVGHKGTVAIHLATGIGVNVTKN